MTFGVTEMASSAVAKFTTGPRIRCSPDATVAFFMPSSCEFVAALFGLIRCGVQSALVNTSLQGKSLVHALTSALVEGGSHNESDQSVVKAVLVSPELRPVGESLTESGQLPSTVAIIECGPGCEVDPWVETKRFAYHGRKTTREKQNITMG